LGLEAPHEPVDQLTSGQAGHVGIDPMDVQDTHVRVPPARVRRHHRHGAGERLVVIDREQDLAVHAAHLWTEHLPGRPAAAGPLVPDGGVRSGPTVADAATWPFAPQPCRTRRVRSYSSWLISPRARRWRRMSNAWSPSLRAANARRPRTIAPKMPPQKTI